MTRIVVTRILSSVYKGDLAIATAMLDAISEQRPDWQLTLMCRDPVRDHEFFSRYGTVQPELFSESFQKISYGRVIVRLLRYLLWSAGGGRWLDPAGRSFVEIISGSSALVFCGGGSPGGYNLPNLVLHAFFPLLLARRMKVPVIFSAIGLEPNLSLVSRIISRWIFRQAKLVVIRDPADARAVSALDRDLKPVVTADWAVNLCPVPAHELREILKRSPAALLSGTRIGINLRDDHSAKSDYRAGIIELISALMELTDASFVVVSMTRSKTTDDFMCAKEIRSCLTESQQQRMILLEEDFAPEVIKSIISTMDIFISTRLHPTIFSISQAVPTMALHSHSKVRDFMARCDLSEYFFSLENTDSKIWVDAAMRLLGKRQEVSSRIRKGLPELQRCSAENMALLEACIRDIPVVNE